MMCASREFFSMLTCWSQLAARMTAVTMTGPVTMPAVRMDNRPTQVTHFPQVLTTEQALGVRRVAENRSTNGNRLGSAGYGLYNEAATSNSGSDMGPPFVDWEPQLRMRQDIGFTTLAMGGRYKTHQATQRKGGQFRDAFVSSIFCPRFDSAPPLSSGL